VTASKGRRRKRLLANAAKRHRGRFHGYHSAKTSARYKRARSLSLHRLLLTVTFVALFDWRRSVFDNSEDGRLT